MYFHRLLALALILLSASTNAEKVQVTFSGTVSVDDPVLLPDLDGAPFSAEIIYDDRFVPDSGQFGIGEGQLPGSLAISFGSLELSERDDVFFLNGAPQLEFTGGILAGINFGTASFDDFGLTNLGFSSIDPDGSGGTDFRLGNASEADGFGHFPSPLASTGSLLASAPVPVPNTPRVDAVGRLVGARNIDVNGSLYDVTFVDGLCADLFDGCDDPSDFAFQTQADAVAAARALLDVVFVDSPAGLFDSNPSLTRTCESAPSTCTVLTPFGFDGPNIQTGAANNSSNEFVDAGVASNFNASTDYSQPGSSGVTFAIWTPVAASTLPPVGSAELYVHLDAGRRVTVDDDVVTSWGDLSDNNFVFDLNRVDQGPDNDTTLTPDVASGQPASTLAAPMFCPQPRICSCFKDLPMG